MDLEKEFFKVLISRGFHPYEARDILSRYHTNLVQSGGATRHSSYSCFSCGGFYSPSFGQPLCSTCHAFLYPESINFWYNLAQRGTKFTDDQKSDSEDSGNEDLGPTVTYGQKDGSNTAVQSPAEHASSLNSFNQNSGSGDDNSASFVGVGIVHHSTPPPDRLADQLRALSLPRPSNERPLPDGLVDRLPTEVLIKIFNFVDDLTLWFCSRVSKRWQRIVKGSTTSQQWQEFVKLRWPLIQPFYAPVCWYKLYGALIQAAPCFACLEHMQIDKNQSNIWASASLAADHGGVGTSLGSKRLHSEIRSLHAEPPAGVEARPLNRQYSHWMASLTGPANSPYEGGKFLLFIEIPDSYPMVPPTIKFLTRIFHPNVSRHGDIGLDVLLHNWSLALTLSKILLSIQSLLTDPSPDACMEPEIGRLYLEDRAVYDCMAQMWTWKYAMIDIFMPLCRD